MAEEYTMTKARLTVCFQLTSETEGFCNAFEPISRAIDCIVEDRILDHGESFHEEIECVNLEYIKNIIDLCSGAVDINTESADRDTRRIKIENLIKDLETIK